MENIGLSSVTDGLLDYGKNCVEVCAAEFGRPRGQLPPPFELVVGGAVPEFRKRPGGAKIILQRDCTVWQHRLQIGHEVTHWLITPSEIFPGVFHWTHEMLANEISLLCLRGSGIDRAEEVADQNEAKWREEALGRTVEEMLTTKLVHPYRWVYGPAFVFGRDLLHAVSWPHLKRLARFFNDRGQPDVRSWLAALPPKRERKALRVIGNPHDGWV